MIQLFNGAHLVDCGAFKPDAHVTDLMTLTNTIGSAESSSKLNRFSSFYH